MVRKLKLMYFILGQLRSPTAIGERSVVWDAGFLGCERVRGCRVDLLTLVLLKLKLKLKRRVCLDEHWVEIVC